MTEIVPFPGVGRLFRHETRVGLADAAPDGRARFDAIARWLQDTALADVTDAGLEEEAGHWIVRRTRLEVDRFPTFGEELVAETFCSALGPLWAERRTTIRSASGATVESVALWVHLDPASGRPLPPTEAFLAMATASAAGRRVKARLRHPDPPDEAESLPWWFRASDLDLADHINNAAYWSIAEEDLVATAPAAPVAAEIEYRAAAEAGPATVLRTDGAWWVAAPDGAVLASIRIT